MKRIFCIACVLFIVVPLAASSQEFHPRIYIPVIECELTDGSIVPVASGAQVGPGCGIEWIDAQTVRVFFASDDIQGCRGYDIFYVDVSIPSGNCGIAHDIDLICEDPINTTYYDETPVVSADGNYLFYLQPGHTIWMVEKNADGLWSNPHALPPSINAGYDEHVGSYRDGVLYFSAKNRAGAGEDVDIWTAEFDPATMAVGAIERVTFDNYSWPMSTPEVYPSTTEDGARMYLKIGPDIGYSDRIDHGDGTYGWDDPVKLSANVNGPASEYCPIISPDGKWLFFNSYTADYGTYKLFFAEKIILTADLAGGVYINPDADPAAGVTIALYEQESGIDYFVTDAVTSADGSYLFSDLYAGDYKVEIVVPLGFASDPEFHTLTLDGSDVDDIDFFLDALITINGSRGCGYWKHQVNVILEGKGQLKESQDDMEVNFPSAIFDKYYDHACDPVMVDGVTFTDDGGGPAPMTLEAMRETFTTRGGMTILEKIRRQYLALLLNIVSGKVGQQVVISEDGANVAQAVTRINELIQLGTTNDLLTAEYVAASVNGGVMLEAGIIPDGTPIIYHAPRPQPRAASLRLPFPNPFNPTTTIAFDMASDGQHRLAVYDATGKLVAVLSEGYAPAGHHNVMWNGTNMIGDQVAAGLYFCRLTAEEVSVTRKIVLIR